ncbi:hypothetical protein FRC14_007490 [Serendipita sp. 396]|nr:hypothetical protein FRC14_007490 [Serendipita sp. 396]KAG8777140.1 hypothetical protein FRC15_011513 [Serendipita sp. 397]KAG8794083.1 hypothetical protein FRC16_010709 [Serendipita sp. 398]KAG8824831.1 hypothetical protein FRC18_010431 [Serendipita sp. 400]KAG8846631.1 hypothetical protein FRB91_000636 [Serendipita sp. 411]KAG8862185.1 hypothetical protein FRC20_011341 [Serendipita sp. 405]
MSQWPHSNWLRAVGPPSQVVFSSPNTMNPSSGGVVVNPASSSSSPEPTESSAQPLASSSGPGTPIYDVLSSNQTFKVGTGWRLGRSAAPPTTIVSPSATAFKPVPILSSSFNQNTVAPITDAMEDPYKQKLQSLYGELESLRRTMRVELDQLETIQRDMKLPDDLQADISTYRYHVKRLKKEKEEARQRFQSSPSGYSNPRIMNMLRTEYDQNQKRIDDQIHQWDELSKKAITKLELFKQNWPSMAAEINVLQVSLTGHETMREVFVQMIMDIEQKSSPSLQEPLDEMIKRIKSGVNREPSSYTTNVGHAGTARMEHSSEA